MGRCSVRNQPTVTATRCLKVTKRRARMRSMHIIFPKGQTVEGKEEREDEEAPEHRTPYLMHPHLTVSRTRTERPRPRPRRRSRRTCKIVRPLGSVRSQDGPRTTHQQHEGGREGAEDGSFSASPSLSLSLSQGFSDVADVKAGGLLRHHVSVMHEEVIPDIEDAKHFTIGAGRGSQNLHFGRKYFRESFESLK